VFNSDDDVVQPTQKQLQEKLRALDEQLRRELRARGFDPTQDENLALTGPLAKLYMERENVKEQLGQLIALENPGDE
jgi:hypothetical protein